MTHEGRFYVMHDALCAPLPVQAHLPILIGGSGPTKTLRTTARYADLWNGYGTPERIAATSEILRRRCVEVGRPFEAIERTVTFDGVIRDTAPEVGAVWAETARIHDLDDRVAADGSERGLTVGGSAAEVADYVGRLDALGIGEVIFTFRAPFDLETVERIAEVREALGKTLRS